MVHLIHHTAERTDKYTHFIIRITADRHFPEAQMDLVHILSQALQAGDHPS